MAETFFKIPVIDMGRLHRADGEAALAEEIAAACRGTGFFSLINHEVPASRIENALQEVRKLFRLDQGTKDAMSIHKSPYMRGYFGRGDDKSDGMNGDIKEGFDLASDLPADDPYVLHGLPFYGPNVWPNLLPGFKDTINAYYDSMLTLGLRLLKLFAIGLRMPPGYFDDKFLKPMAQMRLLRYPPQPADSGEAVGAGAHTDFGWITMIAQDSTGGLELEGRNGLWHKVNPVEGSLTVNIGDLMERWTNGVYRATMHRVVNRASRERHSIAFFMDPNYYTVVDCLKSCVSADNPKKYPPITAGDYMNQRFYDTTTFREANV